MVLYWTVGWKVNGLEAVGLVRVMLFQVLSCLSGEFSLSGQILIAVRSPIYFVL